MAGSDRWIGQNLPGSAHVVCIDGLVCYQQMWHRISASLSGKLPMVIHHTGESCVDLSHVLIESRQIGEADSREPKDGCLSQESASSVRIPWPSSNTGCCTAYCSRHRCSLETEDSLGNFPTLSMNGERIRILSANRVMNLHRRIFTEDQPPDEKVLIKPSINNPPN